MSDNKETSVVYDEPSSQEKTKTPDSTETSHASEKQDPAPMKASSEPAAIDPVTPKDQVPVTPTKVTLKSPVMLSPSNPTTTAILSLKTNPFFNDKRKWEDSFTVSEKKELEGNIVKAARDNDGDYYITLQKEEFVEPQLAVTEEESQDSDDLESAAFKKPGRKPMPDEEETSDPDQDPKIKRKVQNRAAQRAFRERKERYVKELEMKVKQVQDNYVLATNELMRENQQLRNVIYRLESENAALKGIPLQPYQSELSTIPAYQPPSLHPVVQRNSNYPSIAPQPNFHDPIHHYPISNIMTNALQVVRSLSPPPQPKKVSSKPTQPLEYTFSITTPASLRSNTDYGLSKQHTPSEPVELIQLYPPTKPFQKPSIEKELEARRQDQLRKIQQLELDLSDCHIDPEGRLFCQKLRDQVCHDEFHRLLSEPLFDQMGNLSIGPDDTKVEKVVQDKGPGKVLTSQEIWFVLCQQKNIKNYTADELCQKVKAFARYSEQGPVLNESDLIKILNDLN